MTRWRRTLTILWGVSVAAVVVIGAWATIPMLLSSGGVMVVRLVEVRWV